MLYVFFFNDTATTEIYTLSLHDALPIFQTELPRLEVLRLEGTYLVWVDIKKLGIASDELAKLLIEQGKVFINSGTLYGKKRSEEHTSELQSRQYLVCRLLLEKKKQHQHN